MGKRLKILQNIYTYFTIPNIQCSQYFRNCGEPREKVPPTKGKETSKKSLKPLNAPKSKNLKSNPNVPSFDGNGNTPPPDASSTPRLGMKSTKMNADSNFDIQPLMDLNTAGIPASNVVTSSADDNNVKYISSATGLTVVLVSNESQGKPFTIHDRSQIAKMFPSIILMNPHGKGDSLLLGLDSEPDKVAMSIAKLGKEVKNWTFNLENVSSQDPFSFFTGWKIIPKVDKLGMYSLIVNLRIRGKTKMAELEEKRNLMTLIKDCNIMKTMHGDGETMIQVGHVLEFIAYSDSIRKVFSIERRHTWHLRPPQGNPSSEIVDETGNKYVWIKVNCADLNQLSIAHKQFTVNHHLCNVGKVIQLEYQFFGVQDNYLAVFCGKEKFNLENLGPQFNVMRLTSNSLPDSLIPTYGVDDYGFYTVSGTFPTDVGFDVREQFATDMKTVGAVGFRSREGSDEEFSLHFVNSRCLEQINKFAQYSSFNLKIHSSLIRKPSLEKKIRKLVPAILKIKEVQSRPMEDVKVSKKVTIVEDPKVEKEVSKEGDMKVVKKKEKENQDPKLNVIKEKIPDSKTKIKYESKAKVETKVEKIAKVEVKHSGDEKGTLSSSTNIVKTDVFTISEEDLMKIQWTYGKSIPQATKSIGRFFNAVGHVDVVSNNGIVFKIADKKKFTRQLKLFSRNDTNSLEKLKNLAHPKIVLQESNKMFGLAMPKRKVDKSILEKQLSKISHKIEDRGGVNIVWLFSKLDFYKVLGNSQINVGFVPCIVNYKEFDPEATAKIKPAVKPSADETPEKVEPPATNKVSDMKFDCQLSEKEVFGFIWKKQPVGKSRIRDDQIISRQLTEFIKTIKCDHIDNTDDGLVFKFCSKEDYTKVLQEHFPEGVDNPQALEELSRKFTLIPSRGSYGVFSGKRIKPEDVRKFGKCKLHMCSLWFFDKMDVIRVLRDPNLNKMYQTLYIDCRNIYILRSIRTTSPLPPVIPRQFYQHQPRFPYPRMAPNQGQGYPSPRPSYPMIGFQSYRLPRPGFFPDPAIVRTVPLWYNYKPRYQSGSLLTKLLPRTAQDSFYRPSPRLNPGNFKYDFMVGKFGLLPSTRLIKNGYKIYKVPYKAPKGVEDVELFLEDKDQYRNKNVADAADEVKKILNGKDEVSGSLKDLKVRRIELFLRDKLGVEDFKFDPRAGEKFLLGLIEGGNLPSSRFEDITEETPKQSLTPDLLGLYTITIPYTAETIESLSSMLEEDVSWFESPVSVLPVIDPSDGTHILEIKMKDEQVTLAAYQGLKHKYPGLDVDKTGEEISSYLILYILMVFQ